jgi:hypothetical protein
MKWSAGKDAPSIFYDCFLDGLTAVLALCKEIGINYERKQLHVETRR